jgi:hypothetical protein
MELKYFAITEIKIMSYVIGCTDMKVEWNLCLIE